MIQEDDLVLVRYMSVGKVAWSRARMWVALHTGTSAFLLSSPIFTIFFPSLPHLYGVIK
jgi:hypothetical protein